LLFNHLRPFCKIAATWESPSLGSRHTENFQEFLCGNTLVSTKLCRLRGS